MEDRRPGARPHGRLYEHLRDNTEEGTEPNLEQLGPLYQAIAHGCRAGRHQEALDDIYADRICRRGSDGKTQFYSLKMLGAIGTGLAAVGLVLRQAVRNPKCDSVEARPRLVAGLGRVGSSVPRTLS